MRAVAAAVGDHHLERGAHAVRHHALGPHAGLRAEPVGDDAAVRHAGDHLLHRRVVDAQHGEAVERDVADELVVAGGHRLGAAPVVQVLGVHVGDHGDGGGQAQEAAVALVGLHHHPVALAQPGVGAVGVDDAAVDHGRVHVRGLQHGGDHGGGGGLAVRAADGDGPAQAHQLGQHLGPAHHGDQPGAGGHDLRVVAADRGGGDDDLRRAEVGGVVPDRDRDAALAQAADVGAVGDVAALHGVAEVVQHLRDAGHADAADADEVDGADAERERPHAATRAWASTRSARRAAASGRAAACAACPARVSTSGMASREASRCGSVAMSRWAITQPAPAASAARALAVWWSSIAPGSGTRMAGRPATASSATVEAPARAMTRAAAASRSGMSVKNDDSSAGMPDAA